MNAIEVRRVRKRDLVKDKRGRLWLVQHPCGMIVDRAKNIMRNESSRRRFERQIIPMMWAPNGCIPQECFLAAVDPHDCRKVAEWLNAAKAKKGGTK